MLGVSIGCRASCRAHNPADVLPEMPRRVWPDRVVFAGSATILAEHFPGVDPSGTMPLCLGDIFSTKEKILEHLETLWHCRDLGPSAVWPFALSLIKLLREGVALSQIYVGRRTGRYYFSDKNEMWKDVTVFSGRDYAATAGKDVASFVAVLAKLLGIDPDTLPAKTPAFLRAQVERPVKVWVTAGSTEEERELLCAEYNKAMETTKDAGASTITFVPVLLQREAFQIALPIILGNTAEEQPFGYDAHSWGNGFPEKFVGVFIGRTTTHLASWDKKNLAHLIWTQRMSSAARYSAHTTPVPPTSFVSMLDLGDTDDFIDSMQTMLRVDDE